MLVGCLIRGYKTYANVNFIPLIKQDNQKLSIFIGENGSGKSSVLEAIDVCFNLRKWNFNIGSKKSESFINPIFLIKKSECQITSKALSLVSDYFWKYPSIITNSGNIFAIDGFEKFIQFRDEIKNWASPVDYYLISIGINSDGETYFTSTLDKRIRNGLRVKGVSFKDLDYLKDDIFSLYRYIYLPVEITTREVLNIESLEFQGLMDKNLILEIESILKNKINNVIIVDEINKKLDDFLDQINLILNSDGYTYNTPAVGQKKVSANDIVSSIIKSYFSNRSLQKDKKTISILSSGEQRRALIDVAHAFIKKSSLRQKKLIFAIDEPEASLVNRSSYEQFRKIKDISEQNNCQAIIATHWYGLLMTSDNAALHHVSNENSKIEIKSFDLINIHESRRDFPDSVSMKSFFDLVSSLLSIIKCSGGYWIVCEGSDDKNYLSKLLGSDIKDLTILPVGGIANVIKMHNYFKIAVEDNSERKLIKGKILCIIDTDEIKIEIAPCRKKEESEILKIRRFQIDNGEAKLVEPNNSGAYSKTVLEDCLPSGDYFDACKQLILDSDESLKLKLNSLSKFAMINHEMSFLNTDKISVRNQVKNLILTPRNKYLISEKFNSTTTVSWVEKIKSFFND